MYTEPKKNLQQRKQAVCLILAENRIWQKCVKIHLLFIFDILNFVSIILRHWNRMSFQSRFSIIMGIFHRLANRLNNHTDTLRLTILFGTHYFFWENLILRPPTFCENSEKFYRSKSLNRTQQFTKKCCGTWKRVLNVTTGICAS